MFVRLFITFVYCIETSKKITIPLQSFYSFSAPIVMAIFRWGPPLCRRILGYEKIAIFYQYLALSRKWYKIESLLEHQYRMVPFPVTLVTPKLHFKVTIISERQITQITKKWYKVELQPTVNDRLSESFILSIYWYHLQWPCPTSDPEFKGTPLFNVHWMYWKWQL